MDPLIATAMVALIALVALWVAYARKGRSEHQALAYLKGVTYVLSDDPDAAIAELSRAAQLNSQTVETYFALGALFRRKGDGERAIRLHRNLLLWHQLAPEVKRRAQLELALDLRRSGLHDQAAAELEKLLRGEPENRRALVQYRQLLEEAGQWTRAIELQSALVRLDGQGTSVLGHLLSAAARASGSEAESAVELSARAVELCPSSPDALLGRGEALEVAGRRAEVMAPVREALELEPELASRVAALLLRSHTVEEVVQLLTDVANRAGAERGAACRLALAALLAARGASEAAIGVLRTLLSSNPHLWEARKELGALLLSRGSSEELLQDYQQVLEALGRPALAFMCDGCHQKLLEFAFRCPSCGVWDRVHRERSTAAATPQGGAPANLTADPRRSTVFDAALQR